MAKLTLATIGSRYASVAALNSNFDLIETALNNTLSRDGTSPNQLTANIDANNQTVLNLRNAVDASEAVPYGQLLDVITNSSGDMFVSQKQVFVADDGDDVFTFTTLSYTPGINNLMVFVNGSKQLLSTNYSETSSTSITFTSPLNEGDVVECLTNQPTTTVELNNLSYSTVGSYTATGGELSVTSAAGTYLQGQNNLKVYVNGVFQTQGDDYNETSSSTIEFVNALSANDKVTFVKNEVGSAIDAPASAVAYTPAGTGAVATNVQAKLRETVSVLDFGAVGDGVTDDTAAIQAAVDAASIVIVPSGTYRVDGCIMLSADYKTLLLHGALIRKTAYSASTRPVVRIKGNYCSIQGIGPAATIWSENAAPDGVLLWGSENPGDVGGSDAVNSRHVNVSKLRIRAKDGGGSGVALALLSSQFYSTGALYDGIFSDLVLVGGEKQIYLNPVVNGNTFNNINFYETRGYGLYLDGISGGSITDNVFSNFFSDAAVSNTASYYGRYVVHCCFSNMGGEPGAGAYVDFDSTCSVLVWTGYDNHPSGGSWAAQESFYTANGTTKLKSISFPATQVPSADGNTLDDYEEKTFSPTAIGTSTAGTGTYTTQSGTYTKIGNRVLFDMLLTWTAHTGTGNLRITGLPFLPGASTPVSLRITDVSMTAGKYMQGYIFAGVDAVILEQIPTGGGTTEDIPMDTAGSVWVSGCYRV
jgi:hypothetical protein